jgi:hypothetical protein
MKHLPVIAIVVLGLAAACSAKNDAKTMGGAPAPPPPERADPGPISPNSWLLNPPQQLPR